MATGTARPREGVSNLAGRALPRRTWQSPLGDGYGTHCQREWASVHSGWGVIGLIGPARLCLCGTAAAALRCAGGRTGNIQPGV